MATTSLKKTGDHIEVREIIDARNGMICMRTNLLNRAMAEFFAQSLRDRGAYEVLSVEESPKAKDAAVRWAVYFMPRSAKQLEAMAERQQRQREERARTERFTVVKNEDGDWYNVHNLDNDETYETTLEGCSCDDFETRCKMNAIRCKHSCRVLLALERGEVGEFERIPARRAA